MFPRVETLIDPATRADLGRQMQARKRALSLAPAGRSAGRATRTRTARPRKAARVRKTGVAAGPTRGAPALRVGDRSGSPARRIGAASGPPGGARV